MHKMLICYTKAGRMSHRQSGVRWHFFFFIVILIAACWCLTPTGCCWVLARQACSAAASQAASPHSDLSTTAPFLWQPMWAAGGPGLRRFDGWEPRSGPAKEKLQKEPHLCASSTDMNADSDRIKAHHERFAAWFQVHAFICMNKNAEPGQTRRRGGNRLLSLMHHKTSR